MAFMSRIVVPEWEFTLSADLMASEFFDRLILVAMVTILWGILARNWL